jgi:hypothetical protein
MRARVGNGPPERPTLVDGSEIRAGVSSYLIFGGIGVLCVAVSAIDGLLINLLVSIGFLTTLILWVRSYKISIIGNRFSYASLLSSFSVERLDVDSVKPIFFVQRSTPVGLKVRLKNNPTEYTLTLKPFSKSDIDLILCFFQPDIS